MNTANNEPKKLKDITDENKLNWRTFVKTDKIMADWSSPGTPLYYVIDPKGVIRHKWTGYPGEKTLERTLEPLIVETERNLRK